MELAVTNPYTQKIFTKVKIHDENEIAEIVARAFSAQKQWYKVPLADRKELLTNALSYFQQHAQLIATDVTLQMGKPIREARAEIQDLVNRAQVLISKADQELSPTIITDSPAGIRKIIYEPKGIILYLAAWNFPLLNAIDLIIPALLAGNVVLLKHSEQTPLCGIHFAKAFGELSIPNLLQQLVLNQEQTQHLLQNPLVHAVANRIEGVGKAAAFLSEDTELSMCLPQIAESAFYNAGQSSTAIQRLYVHNKLYPNVCEMLSAFATPFTMDDPLLESTQMGPLVSAHPIPFIEEKIKMATSEGAEILCGGQRAKHHLGFMPPTILANVPQKSAIMQNEIFAPVICITTVKNDREAAAGINDCAYRHHASIWTSNPEKMAYFTEECRVDTLYQNACSDHVSPFTFSQFTRRKNLNFS